MLVYKKQKRAPQNKSAQNKTMNMLKKLQEKDSNLQNQLLSLGYEPSMLPLHHPAMFKNATIFKHVCSTSDLRSTCSLIAQGLHRVRFFWPMKFVGLPGFEPRTTAPKTVVLPLHHNPRHSD